MLAQSPPAAPHRRARRLGFALVLSLASSLTPGLAPDVRGAELIHVAQDASGRISQTVELADAWGTGNSLLLASRPLDVEVRVEERRLQVEAHDRRPAHPRPPGATTRSPTTRLLRDEQETEERGLETLRLAFDIDGDESNEIVFVEREVRTYFQVDDFGDPIEGPFLDALRVRVHFLDREDGNLLAKDVPLEPEQAELQALMEQSLPEEVETALQLALGESLMTRGEFPAARYRLVVVKEWAERYTARWRGYSLERGSVVDAPDPDDPAVMWMQALRRIEALPPALRRLYR